MMRYSIHIVDDEDTIRDSLSMALSDDYDVFLYPTAESFISASHSVMPDLVLMDIGLPEMNGIEALEIIKKKTPEMPVIMITAYEDINMVIRSMKNGAFDFILKPINLDVLEITIQKAIATITLRKEVKILQEKYLKENQPCFIAESKTIENVMDFIKKVAKSPDTPIMIIGDTGTGKEFIARTIHAHSPVFQGPFITVNCAAIPEELIESELFGYEEGAFSGAKKSGKRGFVEEADGGTLFLDEVAELSAPGQAKLLRFLENGEFYRVGSTKLKRIQTRVVSATNKDLEAMIETDTFRKDLYFRLGVVKADIPSLNERKGDILPLAKHFMHEFNQKFEKHLEGIADNAREILLSHNWTGNVRELKNMIERGVLVSGGKLLETGDLGVKKEIEHVSLRSDSSPGITMPELTEQGVHLDELIRLFEITYMQAALDLSDGNESLAARYLNMNHHTFRYRWKKLNESKNS